MLLGKQSQGHAGQRPVHVWLMFRKLPTYVCSYIITRVHNKRREGEYPTFIIACTNALRNVHTVNYRILILILVDSFVDTRVFCK